jgi:hypothetical protein
MSLIISFSFFISLIVLLLIFAVVAFARVGRGTATRRARMDDGGGFVSTFDAPAMSDANADAGSCGGDSGGGDSGGCSSD